MDIAEATRRDIIDYLITNDIQFSGTLGRLEFLARVWDLQNMPSTDYRCTNAYGDIWQHCIENDDWDDHYLLWSYLKLPTCDDEIFCKFVENCIHPIIRPHVEQQRDLVEVFNSILRNDNYGLYEISKISGKPVYKAKLLGSGVQGGFKNLIFGAKGEKPEIVLIDAVSNDIKIVKNEQYCLVYNKPILDHGLLWSDLIEWWCEREDLQALPFIEQERQLYSRLFASLASPPEKLLFKAYFEQFRQSLGEQLPALIPQVYLHYDPYTIYQLANEKNLVRQRMDFLLLFSNRERVVLEVDGRQHYSKDNTPRPDLYAEMVAEDRRLRLSGYEIYRFGGYELQGEQGKNVVIDFFKALFQQHAVKK